MSFATPSMVVSGKPYRVLFVSEHSPASLDDFVTADGFTVDMDGTSYRVHGVGRLLGNEVRFHEKDVDNSGKDIRVWKVARHEDGTFHANHAASF